ncbi:MAG: molybdenum ABC transporter ATP-binding protein [Xanthomonadales bacterium]
MSIRARFTVDRGDFRLDVDLELPSRGVTSLFGPSGCGKTTLLRAIAGLDRHPGGRLRFGDQTWQDDTRFVPPHQRPVGYVFQEASLFEHLDVRGNIDYGAKRVPPAERRVEAAHAVALLDLGALLDRKPESLSGGERQRVAIARALAVSPRLLLMDEPLAAVDQTRKQEILPYIESLHRELDIPVIHVSHLPDEVARFADRLVLMREGRVLAAGDVHDMLTRLDLPLAHESRAAAVIDAVVTGTDPAYHLTRVAFDGGELMLSRSGLPTGAPVRLRIEARDVSLTLERQTGTSILNILEAEVAELRAENDARVVVRLMAGTTPLLAGITRKSAEELGLAPGRTVYAQVKSVALLG